MHQLKTAPYPSHTYVHIAVELLRLLENTNKVSESSNTPFTMKLQRMSRLLISSLQEVKYRGSLLTTINAHLFKTQLCKVVVKLIKEHAAEASLCLLSLRNCCMIQTLARILA